VSFANFVDRRVLVSFKSDQQIFIGQYFEIS
jgi:hypothetical protein